MSDRNSARAHRTWEDWLGIALGLLIIFAPWLTNENHDSRVLTSATVTGIAVLMLAELDLVQFRRGPEIGLLACGLWTAVAPFALSYGGQLRSMHVAAGLVVAILGAMGLRERAATDR